MNSGKHALRNAIVVSPQDAQNQRGKRFKSSRANQRLKHQARRCKKIMHISKWDLLIYTPVQTQPRQSEYCQACTQERYRCLTARCSESAGKAFQIITGKSTTQTPSKKMQEDARRSCISRNGICSFTHRCKLNRDKVNSVKHALRNAIVVSPQDAQNQRGKRFKSSRANQRLKHEARRCKMIMHISKWDLLIYTPVQTQPRQGE